jgi:hypothetical protein
MIAGIRIITPPIGTLPRILAHRRDKRIQICDAYDSLTNRSAQFEPAGADAGEHAIVRLGTRPARADARPSRHPLAALAGHQVGGADPRLQDDDSGLRATAVVDRQTAGTPDNSIADEIGMSRSNRWRAMPGSPIRSRRAAPAAIGGNVPRTDLKTRRSIENLRRESPRLTAYYLDEH